MSPLFGSVIEQMRRELAIARAERDLETLCGEVHTMLSGHDRAVFDERLRAARTQEESKP